ncbi:MAG: hypothetical protein ABI488_26630 [Polyangiaceae bacterium]
MTGAMRRWVHTPKKVLLAPACAWLGAFAALQALAGCAAAERARGVQSAPLPGQRPNAAATGTAAPGAPAKSGAAPAPAAAFLPRLSEITLDPKQPLRPLPELKVLNIGLHVGGGPNDADTKAPFMRAVAERFPQFMDCYRKNEDPAKGGRFGIDLHIPRAGGHPSVEQPRTAMHGPEFRACVSRVFESVAFQKPTHGSTTISYSLHFTVGDAP